MGNFEQGKTVGVLVDEALGGLIKEAGHGMVGLVWERGEFKGFLGVLQRFQTWLRKAVLQKVMSR